MAPFKETRGLVSETTAPVLTSLFWGSVGLVTVKKQSAVVYIEPRIVVSPFALAVN